MSEAVTLTSCQQIVEKLPQAVVVVDAEGNRLWANHAAFVLLGADVEQLSELDAVLQGRLDEWLSRAVIETENGITLKKSCIELEEGGFAFLFEPQPVQRSENDLLTGLTNQQTMKVAAQSLLSVARRYEKPLSAMLIQIDNLAELPHDPTLLALAQCLKEHLRWADLVARHGGDGFIVILPETDQQACDALQGKMEDALSQLQIEGCDASPRCAVAMLESDKRDDIDRLTKRLEDLLYKQVSAA